MVKVEAPTTNDPLEPPKGYEWRRLSKASPRLTLFRKTPKVRGKAAVKAAKRERHRKRNQQRRNEQRIAA